MEPLFPYKNSAPPQNKSEQYVGGVTHETLSSRCVGGTPELNNITRDDQGQAWEELEVTVDSGAAVTVMPVEMCKYVPSEKTDDIGPFRAANGATIANLGMRSLKGFDENNMPMVFALM